MKCKISEDVVCPVCEQTGLRGFVEATLQTVVLVPGDVWKLEDRLIGMRLLDILDRAAVVEDVDGRWQPVEDQVHEICAQILENIGRNSAQDLPDFSLPHFAAVRNEILDLLDDGEFRNRKWLESRLTYPVRGEHLRALLEYMCRVDGVIYRHPVDLSYSRHTSRVFASPG